WKGRELDVVTGAEAIGHFKGIRADLEKVPVAFTMLEAIDHVAVERQPMPEAFRLLVGALATLDKGAGPVLLGAFLLKLLVLEGVGPSTDRCARCTKEAVLVAFDPEAGGFLCRDCRSGRAVPQETMALVRQVLGGELRTALGAPASRTTADFERLVMLGTEHHLERRLRSASSSVVKGTLHQRDLSQEPA
ncbi:MAG: DNA repair protein RecO, partial [Acidimicrobiales bacterium]